MQPERFRALCTATSSRGVATYPVVTVAAIIVAPLIVWALGRVLPSRIDAPGSTSP